MKKSITVLLLSSLLAISGCAVFEGSTPYVAPEVCTAEGATSLILEKYPDPRVLDKSLLIAQVTAMKSIDGYDYAKATEVLDELEAFVEDVDNMTYSELITKIITKVKLANEDAGAIIFILGPGTSALQSSDRISDCDRYLIKTEFDRQRLLIAFYQ